MSRRSIRFRLTLWYAVVLTAGLCLFGGLTWLALRQRLLAEIDSDLQNRARQFEDYFTSQFGKAAGRPLTDSHLRNELQEFCQALPPGSYVHVESAGGFVFRYPESPELRGSGRGGRRIPKSKTFRQSFTSLGEVFDLELGAPMEDVVHTLDLLRLLLLSLIPAVIAIGAFGGAWLSGRALKPVHDITAAALNISIENLSERLPVPDTGDEIARLTAVLNTMLERLETAVGTLSQFVADASHELRTPLAVLRATAELALRRQRPAESYRQSLQEVATEAERMTRLVEELLVLARSDAEMAEMPLGPVDLRDVLEDVAAGMRTLAEIRQIRVRSSLGDSVAMISGNRPALYRLFLVLVDNAIKYSPVGGKVMLTIDRYESEIAVAIQDFGSGISPADLPHIFKRFYQADRARTDGGHGLGLALAQSIARAHGCAIDVRSSKGAGSVFRVAFAAREIRQAGEPIAAADAHFPGAATS